MLNVFHYIKMFIITQYNKCWMFLNRMNAAGLFELNIGRMNVERMGRIYKMVWMSFEIWGETEWMFDLRFEDRRFGIYQAEIFDF